VVWVKFRSKGARLTFVDNTRSCTDRFLIFCTQYSYNSSYAVLLSSGNEYGVRGWNNSLYSDSKDSGYIAFDNVPINGLTEFRIKGPGWSSGVIQLGVSQEENNAVNRLRQELAANSASMTFRAYSMLLNRQSDSPYAIQVVMDALLEKLKKTNDVAAYSAVIDQLDDRVIQVEQRTRDLGVNFLEAIYNTQLKGTNDTAKFANFLATDGSQLPQEKFDKIFNQGVELETKRIESVIDKLNHVSLPSKILLRVSGENSIEQRKEKFLRSVYSSAIEEKRNNRVIRSMMIYKALLQCKAASGSSAVFDLQRDQEMRDFLATQFEKIRNELNSSSQRLVGEIRSMSKQLNTAIDKVAENTTAAQESRAEEYARNVRMTTDMFYQNRYLEGTNGHK
jgi:hypothetical protein